jgi:glutathione-specific gamma-glutamylcyclotransferase
MRSLYMEAFGGAGHALDDFQLSDSLTATLAAKPKGAGWWVFAYGSLLWNPLFPFVEARPAIVRRLHRRFCLYSMASRGTRDAPGLVLGLDRGGACRGMAFRIARADVEEAMHYLWDREMNGGVYRFRSLTAALEGGGTAQVRAFVVDRGHKNYAGRLSIDETARLILQGIGAKGHCREYLENTVRQLETLGLVDGPLHRLELRVKELAATELPCAD